MEIEQQMELDLGVGSVVAEVAGAETGVESEQARRMIGGEGGRVLVGCSAQRLWLFGDGST